VLAIREASGNGFSGRRIIARRVVGKPADSRRSPRAINLDYILYCAVNNLYPPGL